MDMTPYRREGRHSARCLCGAVTARIKDGLVVTHLRIRNTDDPDAALALLPGPTGGAAESLLISEIHTDRQPGYGPLSGDHRTKTRTEYERDSAAIEGDDP